MTEPTRTDFVRVHMYCGPNSHVAHRHRPEEVIVRVKDLPRLIEAILQRHYTPGVHPETGMGETQVQTITASRQIVSGPYWWATPGLKVNGDIEGVEVYSWEIEQHIWRRVGADGLHVSIPMSLLVT